MTPTCREWSPELPDHHAAADWRESHRCKSGSDGRPVRG